MLLDKKERDDLRQTMEFRDSNKLWNDLNLNSKKSVGCLMFLIKESGAKSFEEWESYYFASGAKRKSANIRSQDVYFNEYGRATDELLEIAKKFNKKLNVDIELVYNYVYIRVIDETWIGYQRELVAFDIIKEKCINASNEVCTYDVSGVDYYTDIKYAVDFEIFKNGKLTLAIQLKSTKYLNSNLIAVDDIKAVNKEKNKKYTNINKVSVLYLYINGNQIINISDLKLL